MKNKGFILFILTAAVICLIFIVNRNDENAANKTDIEKVRQEFRSQFNKVLIELDSVKAELKATKAQVDLIKADTDTLKQGEAIIYNEIKKANDKTIWDFFK